MGDRGVSVRFVTGSTLLGGRRAAAVGLAPRGIEAEQVLLRTVTLPPLLTTAIQEKLQAEQQAQRMRFVLDRERL